MWLSNFSRKIKWIWPQNYPNRTKIEWVMTKMIFWAFKYMNTERNAVHRFERGTLINECKRSVKAKAFSERAVHWLNFSSFLQGGGGRDVLSYSRSVILAPVTFSYSRFCNIVRRSFFSVPIPFSNLECRSKERRSVNHCKQPPVIAICQPSFCFQRPTFR